MICEVHNADALDILRRSDAESVDAVVTDPPYGMDYQSKRFAKIQNDKLPFIWWLLDAWRVTKEGGALICFCNWGTADTWKWAIECAGWEIKSQVIWDRVQHGTGDTKAQFAPRHDVIWFAVKGRFAFPWKRPASVLQFTRPHGEEMVHPNQKPKDLMEYLCRVVCPAGGTVLDPFTGSGATGEGAVSIGNRFIGIEIEQQYAELARHRIALANPVGRQQTLEGLT